MTVTFVISSAESPAIPPEGKDPGPSTPAPRDSWSRASDEGSARMPSGDMQGVLKFRNSDEQERD